LKSGYANLLIGGFHHAIQENGVPGMRSALRAFRVCVRAEGFVGHDSCGERSRTISRAVNRSKVNAALQLAEKTSSRVIPSGARNLSALNAKKKRDSSSLRFSE
jgi:hypothetical protein